MFANVRLTNCVTLRKMRKMVMALIHQPTLTSLGSEGTSGFP